MGRNVVVLVLYDGAFFFGAMDIIKPSARGLASEIISVRRWSLISAEILPMGCIHDGRVIFSPQVGAIATRTRRIMRSICLSDGKTPLPVRKKIIIVLGFSGTRRCKELRKIGFLCISDLFSRKNFNLTGIALEYSERS